jgi:glycosyltransferase involved in cell wall biosynthesis
MKVGLITHHSFSTSDSLNQVFGTVAEALRRLKHEVVLYPPEFVFAPRERKRRLIRELLLASDVVLGSIDDAVLQVRESLGRRVPYVCFLLGSMSRGAPNLVACHHLFRTTDALVGNCTADVELTNKFFTNARTPLLPFAFDEAAYRPFDEAARRALKAKLGFGEREKILLYSGRLTLEKNVHTLLRVFSVLRRLVPESRLLLVGDEYNDPFPEFGIFTVGIGRTLERTAEQLGIPEERVSFLGRRNTDELCGLYNVADVLVNMTLHHDENFGLSQVEAMGCGTPVVGTNWGGLKDTVVDGETGYKVSAVVTSSGVKVNWWEAVNRLTSLLTAGDDEQRRLRGRCRAAAVDRYSLATYCQLLEAILAECLRSSDASDEPLRASAFARQYWGLCTLQWGEPPPYRRGPRSYEMYRELMTDFAGTSQASATGGPLENLHVLSLATPVRQTAGDAIEIDDPIFPFEVTPPNEHREAVRAALEVMRAEPVVTVGRLVRTHLREQAGARDALAWMLDTGLLLRSRPEPESVALRSVGAQMGQPLFSIQGVSHTADAIVIR